MVDLSTSSDEEQIDAIKSWWKENGLSIALGIGLGLGGIFGWKYWQTYQVNQKVAASLAFETVQGDVEKSKDFVTSHEGNVYAADLALSTSATLAAKGEYEQAINLLLPIVNTGSTRAHRLLARIHLAKVYVASNKAQLAFDLLAKEKDYGSFSAQQQWALGDALVQLGKISEAKDAYQLALVGLKSDPALSGLLQLKLNNL